MIDLAIHHRRWAWLLLASYVILSSGSHAVHSWLGVHHPPLSSCPCGMTHEGDPGPLEEEFSADLAWDRRYEPPLPGSPCSDEGACSICQYHAQGQWVKVQSPLVAPVVPRELHRAIVSFGTPTPRPFCSLPRAPPAANV